MTNGKYVSPGRPEEVQDGVQVTLYVENRVKKQLEEDADKLGTTFSEHVRTLLGVAMTTEKGRVEAITEKKKRIEELERENAELVAAVKDTIKDSAEFRQKTLDLTIEEKAAVAELARWAREVGDWKDKETYIKTVWKKFTEKDESAERIKRLVMAKLGGK